MNKMYSFNTNCFPLPLNEVLGMIEIQVFECNQVQSPSAKIYSSKLNYLSESSPVNEDYCVTSNLINNSDGESYSITCTLHLQINDLDLILSNLAQQQMDL